MEPNLTRHYLGIATNSARRSQQAERGWLVEQAAAAQKPSRAIAMRRLIGGLMIAAGQRVQGLPEPSVVMMDPAHAHWGPVSRPVMDR